MGPSSHTSLFVREGEPGPIGLSSSERENQVQLDGGCISLGGSSATGLFCENAGHEFYCHGEKLPGTHRTNLAGFRHDLKTASRTLETAKMFQQDLTLHITRVGQQLELVNFLKVLQK